jgi:hypothetical protein
VDGSSEAKFNEASAQLSEGLKSCRNVVDGYRGLLKNAASNDAESMDDRSDTDLKD